MSVSAETLLVVSASARALVRAARRSGRPVLAMDGFGDQDTRAHARSFIRVGIRHGGLERRDLGRGLRRALAFEGLSGLIYGGGAEAAAGLLAEWGVSLPVYGNTPEVVRATQAPAAFFALLDGLHIPYPAVRLSRPRHPAGWLVKRAGGSGGTHIRRLSEAQAAVDSACYFQREIAGPVLSVSFLADGHEARIVGFNTLWTAADQRRGFSYGGAVNRAPLAAAQRERLGAHVQALVAELGLIGLNGLDVVMAGGEPLVLELNPRPGATFELYDARPGQGLLAWHIRACQGSLPPPRAWASSPIRGHEIVYADRPLSIAAGAVWPDWCTDRPWPGSRIGRQEPLCTVHARGTRLSAVMSALRVRRTQVLSGIHAGRRAA